MAKVQTGIHNSTGTPCYAQSAASCPLDSNGGHSNNIEEFAAAATSRGLDGARVLEIIKEGNSPKDALSIVSSQVAKITKLEKKRGSAARALGGSLSDYFASSARTMGKARERANLQKLDSLSANSMKKAQRELMGEKRDYTVVDNTSVENSKSSSDASAITLQKIRENASASTDAQLTKNVKSALSEARASSRESKVVSEISASHSRPASAEEAENLRSALSASRANR